MSQDYNSTLNLPKTDFPMRANLSANEAETFKSWEENRIYEKLMKKNAEKPLYVLHDGPPYANGNIHMGHALNKILKDFVVRYKNMTGFNAPFVPGWDTHGLPTELKARAKAGVNNSEEIDDVELRKLCKEFVLGYMNDQRNQFKRLGILADWENPYITLDKEFEAKQIEVFAEMADKGHIYRGLKPVYWCSECKTALAEAEIEYANDKCFSIFVKFNVKDDKGKLAAMGADLSKTFFVIWTTTTWTLPGNVAICVGPTFDYVLVRAGGEFYVMAEALYKNVMSVAGIEEYEVVGTLKGNDLEYMVAQHTFLNRDSLVIVGDHVTLESGTGCVHTAPGHGVEDYEVCRKYSELPMVVPVDADGKLTNEAGDFAGLHINAAGKPIADKLRETGHLLAVKKLEHQYPHCWRCKEPVIFRATKQWFCSVEAFKDKAVEEIKNVKWVPAWGEERITSMVRDRKDWCISRQRKWGVPIPIFFCKNCGEPIIQKAAMLKVASLFREHGSDAWFTHEANEILKGEFVCKNCGCHDFIKEKDIMDVWFDSGSSHEAVCATRANLSVPADLYLEGADQYRGWFQSSLLTSVATRGTAPYKTVVTHGWVVDGNGKKMSKSLGNGIEPSEIVDKYGSDILRLWVASADYHADIRVSHEILKQLSEAYRKIRNTARYILGNLYDFDPQEDMIPLNDLLPFDKWALMKLDEVIEKSIKGYENFEFHQVYHAIHKFCVVDMSNFYLDVLKDRLYVEAATSATRRKAQTAMYLILNALVKLTAPILSHTADEIWKFMPHLSSDDLTDILFNEMPAKIGLPVSSEAVEKWDKIEKIRADVQKALELARKDKLIGSALGAKVTIFCDGDLFAFLESAKTELQELFIVSGVELVCGGVGDFVGENVKGLSVTVSKADGEKCERCWSFSETVGKNATKEKICARCAAVLGK